VGALLTVAVMAVRDKLMQPFAMTLDVIGCCVVEMLE
jgi:hypothetical protein